MGAFATREECLAVLLDLLVQTGIRGDGAGAKSFVTGQLRQVAHHNRIVTILFLALQILLAAAKTDFHRDRRAATNVASRTQESQAERDA
jgi:hypothetical protein